MDARGPQNGRRGLERGVPKVFGCSHQLLLNKFLDPSTPSLRKVGDGEKIKEKKERKECCLKLPLTSLPFGRPNSDRLERCTLVPMFSFSPSGTKRLVFKASLPSDLDPCNVAKCPLFLIKVETHGTR